MKLTVTIVQIEHGSKYMDARPRVTLKVHEAEGMFREIKLAVDTLEPFTLGEMHDLILEGVFVPGTIGT